MMRRISIATAFLIIAVCILGSMFILPCRSAEAKTSRMKLPSKVVVDHMDEESGEWKENYTVYYKYNKKGDIVRIDLRTPTDDGEQWIPSLITYKYTKKGVKKSAIATDSYGVYVYEFDNKGRVKSVVLKGITDKLGEYITTSQEYKYDKKGNIVSRTWTTDDETYEVKKATEKYTTKSKKNGSKTIKIVRTSWMGIKSTDTVKYSSKGLLSRKQTVYSEKDMDPEDWKYTYEMSKDGKYVQRRYSNEFGARQRRTYTYGKIKASRSKYLNILNLDEKSLIGNTRRNQM